MTRFLGWLLAVLGLSRVVVGGVWASYADSAANRQANELADIGVVMGLGVAVIGVAVLLVGATLLWATRARDGEASRHQLPPERRD